MISLMEIKSYLRINHGQDDSYITALIEVAKSFIAEQTGVIYAETDKVYNQAVLFLIAHLYDNRSPVSEKAVVSVPFTLDALLIHLRIRGAYVEQG